MPTVAASFTGTFSNFIRETLGRAAYECLPVAAPCVFGNGISNIPVIDGNDPRIELGRDLKFNRIYYGTVTGALQGGNINNYRALLGDTTNSFGKGRFKTLSMLARYPNASDSPVPFAKRIQYDMHALEGNLPLTIGQLSLEALDANVMRHVVPHLAGLAKQIALWFPTQFYANPEASFKLGTLPAAGSITVNTTDKTITFAPTEGTIGRFIDGQGVDVYSSGGTWLNANGATRIKLFVMNTDGPEREVTLIADPTDSTFATWATTSNLASGVVTWANSKSGSTFAGLYGYQHFLKPGGTATADNTILGSFADATHLINVDEWSHFKSWRFPSVGQLTETLLQRQLREVSSDFARRGLRMDRLIAAPGVFDSVWESQTGRRYITNDMPAGIKNLGLNKGFQISCSTGESFQGVTDHMIGDSTMIGLALQGNWALVVPPQPTRISRRGKSPIPWGSEGLGKLPIQFLIPGLGVSDNPMWPMRAADGALLSGVEMPFSIGCQLFPMDQIPGAVWSGITTSRPTSTPVT